MAQADAAPAAPAWLAAIDWGRRSAAFGPLHVRNGVIATVYAPLSGDEARATPAARLRALWLELAAHPNLLTPIDDDPDPGQVVVEYPAIYWSFAPGWLVVGGRCHGFLPGRVRCREIDGDHLNARPRNPQPPSNEPTAARVLRQ